MCPDRTRREFAHRLDSVVNFGDNAFLPPGVSFNFFRFVTESADRGKMKVVSLRGIATLLQYILTMRTVHVYTVPGTVRAFSLDEQSHE